MKHIPENSPQKNIVEYVIKLENVFIENFNTMGCYASIGAKLKQK